MQATGMLHAMKHCLPCQTLSIQAHLSVSLTECRPYRQIRAATADHLCLADDEQLLSAVYTLLRAGSESMATNLCASAACGWRAAVMCAAGWGLLPVGNSHAPGQAGATVRSQQAAIAADVLARHEFSEDLTSGYVADACAVRERWRASCGAAAAAAEKRSGSASAAAVAATYESAIFGVLAGSEDHCQAACASWQDRLWVWGRAVLQSEPEQRVLEDAGRRGASSMSQRLRPWQQQLLVKMPSEHAGAPSMRENGHILEQAAVCSLWEAQASLSRLACKSS